VPSVTGVQPAPFSIYDCMDAGAVSPATGWWKEDVLLSLAGLMLLAPAAEPLGALGARPCRQGAPRRISRRRHQHRPRKSAPLSSGRAGRTSRRARPREAALRAGSAPARVVTGPGRRSSGASARGAATPVPLHLPRGAQADAPGAPAPAQRAGSEPVGHAVAAAAAAGAAAAAPGRRGAQPRAERPPPRSRRTYAELLVALRKVSRAWEEREGEEAAHCELTCAVLLALRPRRSTSVSASAKRSTRCLALRSPASALQWPRARPSCCPARAALCMHSCAHKPHTETVLCAAGRLLPHDAAAADPAPDSSLRGARARARTC